MSFLSGHSIIYNQTWEDPYVDAEALEIRDDDRIVALTSGGCNILNTALLNPSVIYAVDSNPAQTALLAAKITGAKTLNYEEYWENFGVGCSGLYQEGRLKTLYTLGHWIQHTCSLSRLQQFAQTVNIEEQARIYKTEIRPRLWHFPNRYIPSVTMLLYGISWRQLWRCQLNGQFFLKDLFEKRLDHLFTHIPLQRNYFWRRIFFGGYPSQEVCPPYLQKKNFSLLKARLNKIVIHTSSLTDFLRSQEESSISVFNLADLPEFLSKKECARLWNEVARTSRPGARILYRNFVTGLPAPKSTLAHFEFAREKSIALSAKEMTGSYAEVLLFTIDK